MNFKIMNLPKVILVSLILMGSIETQSKYSKEYDLINYLACEINDSALVEERFLSWEDWGYDSYSDLPTKIKNSREGLRSFNLDSLLDEKGRMRIEQIIESSSSLSVKIDCFSCKDKLIKTKGFVSKKTIYSYSYPILLKGTNQELYGIILEQETFELNSEIKLKVFVKLSDSWELVFEKLLAFS